MNRSAPKRVARRFLEAVMAGDWPEAVDHVQVSWVKGVPDGLGDAEYLHAVMEPLKIDGYSIGLTHRVRQRPNPPSRALCDVDFTVETNGMSLGGRCRVVREDRRGNVAASGGRWGVNPMSVLIQLRRLQPQEV